MPRVGATDADLDAELADCKTEEERERVRAAAGAKLPDTTAVDWWRILDAGTWLETPLPSPEPIIHGLFDAGGKMVIIGPSKSKKTWFVCNLAVNISVGQSCFGWKTTARRVLLVNMEVGAVYLQRRLLSTAAKAGVSPHRLIDRLFILNGRGYDFTMGKDSPFLDQLIEEIRERQIGLVVLDPLYKLTSGDENSAEDMKPVLAAFDRICHQTGASVVFVHHDAKGMAGDRQHSDRGAGSGIIMRDIDAGLLLTPHIEDGLTVVASIGRNHADIEPVVFKLEDGGLEQVHVDAVTRTTISSKRPKDASPPDDDAVEILSARRGKTDAVKALEDNGWSKRAARATLGKLIASAKLKELCLPGGHRKLVGAPEDIDAEAVALRGAHGLN